VKRVFVLGPAHAYYLRGCALTTFAKYATPFGDLTVDEAVTQELRDTGKFTDMQDEYDVEEHSLEMHMPYLYKRFTQTFPSEADYPTIVPILIGNNNRQKEKQVGQLLAPYLGNKDNAFVVSSDFCHWGAGFTYMAYMPGKDIASIEYLQKDDENPKSPIISESIKKLDRLAINAILTGRHDNFVNNLSQTQNTVCGRHPIGVTMAALEAIAKEAATPEEGIIVTKKGRRVTLKEMYFSVNEKEPNSAQKGHGKGKAKEQEVEEAEEEEEEGEETYPEDLCFKFLRYRQSSRVEMPKGSSVSYVALYATVPATH
jgi:MEMO1 family protein